MLGHISSFESFKSLSEGSIEFDISTTAGLKLAQTVGECSQWTEHARAQTNLDMTEKL